MRRRVGIALVSVLAPLVGAEAVFADSHHFPGFNALVGFASCVVVVVLAKGMGRVFLQRPEDRKDD